MSAADEIAAAIAILEDLREKSEYISPRPFHTDRYRVLDVNEDDVAVFEDFYDQDLFLTLVGTVDAQIAILRSNQYVSDEPGGANELEEAGLALARAINGGNE